MKKNILTLFMVLFSPIAFAITSAPLPIAEVMRHGLPIHIEHADAEVEVDIPLLTPDGNILHLLGTAHPRALDNAAFAEVSADLVGVTAPDCTAHVEVLIDATTRRSLAQKLKMTCLGRSVHDAFVGGVE